ARAASRPHQRMETPASRTRTEDLAPRVRPRTPLSDHLGLALTHPFAQRGIRAEAHPSPLRGASPAGGGSGAHNPSPAAAGSSTAVGPGEGGRRPPFDPFPRTGGGRWPEAGRGRFSHHRADASPTQRPPPSPLRG